MYSKSITISSNPDSTDYSTIRASYMAAALYIMDGTTPSYLTDETPTNISWGCLGPILDKMRGVNPPRAANNTQEFSAGTEFQSSRTNSHEAGVRFRRAIFEDDDDTSGSYHMIYTSTWYRTYGDYSDLYLNIQVNTDSGGIYIGPINSTSASKRPPNWGEGLYAELHINNSVYGSGGGGRSMHTTSYPYGASGPQYIAGYDGWAAVSLNDAYGDYTCLAEIYNNSVIAGGGGGGGGGNNRRVARGTPTGTYGTTWYAGGSGGGDGARGHIFLDDPENASWALSTNSGSGNASSENSGDYTQAIYTVAGNAGQPSQLHNAGGGAGGASVTTSGTMANYSGISCTVTGGAGGAGGGFGSSGGTGGTSSYQFSGAWSSSGSSSGGAGGSPGAAIEGVNKLILSTRGTILGPETNI